MGATPELADYVSKCIRAGRTLYEIKYDLLNEGWNEMDVDQALSETQSHQQPSYAAQQPSPSYPAQQRQYAAQQPQPYQQPQQPQQQPYQQQPQQPQPYQQPQQQPAPERLLSQKAPILGFVLAIVAVVVLVVDVIALKSRAWIDIFNSLSVVDTEALDVGLLVLMVVFAMGIVLGGIISMKRKALPAGMLVILLSFISMLTFAGMLSGLLGIVAGIIILLKK